MSPEMYHLKSAYLRERACEAVLWARPDVRAAPVTSLAAGAVLAVCAVALAGEARGRELHVSQREPADAGGEVFGTIGEAAERVEPGDVVVIHGGVYREAVRVDRSGTAERPITFRARRGARVVVTGADRLTDWTKERGEGNVWSTPWPHRFLTWSKTLAHPDDDFHVLIGRAEQVFADAYPLRQVLRREQMSRGTFYVDLEGKRLYVWNRNNADPTRAAMEASVRTFIWESRGSHVHLKGLRFRYAANPAQHGSVVIRGERNLLEDCVIERSNGLGIRVGVECDGHGTTVRRCLIQDHGYKGVAGCGNDITYTECVVRGNNVKGFNRGWGGGGSKFVLSRNTVVERCVFAENRGTGIWFDIGNEDSVVRNCLVADNENAGIFYEISFGLHAHDNVVVGNGFAAGNAFDAPGAAWGANGGITLSSSPGCLIERNVIVGNCEGFQYREQLRTTPRIGRSEVPIWNHDTVVRNNVIAYNHNAQTGGWFATEDGRHWPRSEQDRRRGARKAEIEADIAEKYLARNLKGYPAGLSLEKLRLTHRDNLYAVDGQDLFLWGCRFWAHDCKVYADLGEVRRELGLEQGSREAEPAFADIAARDFRVPAGSSALRKRCYPKGNVPGVKLGALRGATGR